MSQWRLVANNARAQANSVATDGAPSWTGMVLHVGSGHINAAANTVTLSNTVTGQTSWYTPGKIKDANVGVNMAVAVLPLTPAAYANATGDSRKAPGGTGWVMRKAYTGPITAATGVNGSGFANGETATSSNGSSNATLVITSNATGNIASITVRSGGLFANIQMANNNITFNRENHVANLNFSNSTALVGVGNSNTINFIISNTNISYGVSAVGSFTSNTTGGITNTQTQAVVWSGANVGLFSNAQTNAAVVVTFTNANGTLITGTYTATANLVTSTAGNVTVTSVGGRAGRVTYETLVSTRFIANGQLANSTNGGAGVANSTNVVFPQ